MTIFGVLHHFQNKRILTLEVPKKDIYFHWQLEIAYWKPHMSEGTTIKYFTDLQNWKLVTFEQGHLKSTSSAEYYRQHLSIIDLKIISL